MIKNFQDFFESKHNDIASDILIKIKNSDAKVDVFADYKRGIRIDDKYISVNRSSDSPTRFSTRFFGGGQESYVLVINGTHYDANQRICKKIWNELDSKANELKYKG